MPNAMDRRTFLKLSAASGALAACSRIPGANRIIANGAAATPVSTVAAASPTATAVATARATATVTGAERDAGQAWLVANRVMFGPRPGDVARIAAIGSDAFIDEQLALAGAPEDPALTARLAGLDTLAMSPADILAKYGGDPRGAGIRRDVLLDLQQAAALRAVYSPRQLYEVMVDFWNNHFNVGFNKRFDYLLKPADDRDAIRPHAMGSFRALLGASATSPAVLQSLDNDTSGKDKLNENYGRELLELHTLGADQGYVQADVREAARAFTGWSVVGLRDDAQRAGEFVFRPRQHDEGAKAIMGLKLPPGGGQKDGELLLDYLAEHPNTARHISFKLCRRFVADDPPEAVIAAGAKAFSLSKGDIKATLAAILRSPEFKASAGAKVKRPLEYVASALRALGAETGVEPPIIQALTAMGQPLFLWQPPDGFPDVASAYLGAGAFLARWNFALGLVSGAYRGTRIDAALGSGKGDVIDTLSDRLYGGRLPESAREALRPFAGGGQMAQLVALMLCAPLFQRRG